LRSLKQAASVKGRVNPHAFRHRFACEYISNGRDISTLAKIPGHTDLSTTANYYAVFDEEELHDFTSMTDLHQWEMRYEAMSIPVIVLPFRADRNESLEQNMDDDYMRAFAPQLVEFKQRFFHYSNAYILPPEALRQDEIALLRSRGAIDGQAKILVDTRAPSGNLLVCNSIYLAGFMHYVCVFNVKDQRWLEAYVVPARLPV
jgi:hypothetical protein